MVIKTIDALLLQKLFLAGAKGIEAKKDYINELNVFPVPDGDTGTNMTLTILAAAKEVSSLNEPTISTLSKAISSGSLRGARGNSGVILSQLFRGFTKEIKDLEKIDVNSAAKAFARATETAYKAVMKPKEGTILTVARAGAEKAAKIAKETDDFVYFLNEVITYMEEVLQKTPDMLPVLKEAGVVDSGGQGLMEILKGAYEVLLGKKIDFTITKPNKNPIKLNNTSDTNIKFGYCTEFIIMLETEYNLETEREFKAFLESIGDSIVCVFDEDIVKVHVHTNDPGLAIQKGLTYGSLTNMKIDNMREEHNEKVIKDANKISNTSTPRKKVGFISVCAGNGISEIFKGLLVDYVIEGGQTMNPSTEDMLNAISLVNADTIFILPNNKNIILAANQAKELTKDKNIIVIPSKTIPQGITAVINFVFDKSVDENEKHMIEEMNNVKTGQITYAIRDTTIEGKPIKQNDIMGIGDKNILAVGNNIEKVALETVTNLVDEDSELISLYYGESIVKEDATELADIIKRTFTNIDVEIHFGGQPIYYYIVSVE